MSKRNEPRKERVLVRNAADRKQVKKASKEEELLREEQIADIKFLLTLPEFRRFAFRYINIECHYDTCGFIPSGSELYYDTGERNIGRLMKGECCEADLALYQQAEKENWKQIQEQGESNE